MSPIRLILAALLASAAAASSAQLASYSDSTGMEQSARDLLQLAGPEFIDSIRADGLWENTAEIEERSQALVKQALEVPLCLTVNFV